VLEVYPLTPSENIMAIRNTTLVPIAIMFIGLFIVIPIVVNYTSVDAAQLTVTSKERMITGSGGSQKSFWVVFGEDEVFANRDNFLFLKFNSSDIQRQLEVGKTCQVKVNWFRVPLLSWYRNILAVQECR
jgi:hypothetical protein